MTVIKQLRVTWDKWSSAASQVRRRHLSREKLKFAGSANNVLMVGRDVGRLEVKGQLVVQIHDHGSRRANSADAAEILADRMFELWRSVAVRRGIDNSPLDARWCRDKYRSAKTGHASTDPLLMLWHAPPLPGHEGVDSNQITSGGCSELFKIYAGLRSARMVVTGDAGSGKTTTAIRLLHVALTHRKEATHAQGTKPPVPILLTAHSWNPRYQSLENWFASQLAANHEFLLTGRFGRGTPSALVEDRRVALFLDAFDEMHPELQATAVERINQTSKDLRIIVFARRDEFAYATKAKPLSDAAVVELTRVQPADACTYLKSRLIQDIGADLDRLTQHLTTHPPSAVTDALDNPLTLSLVAKDPGSIEPLLTSAHSTAKDVKVFLLDRVVPLAYRVEDTSTHSPAQALRWLGHLATEMRDQHSDLIWWQMHHTAPARWRCLANTVGSAVLMSGIGSVVFGPFGRYATCGHTGTAFGAVYGGAMGACFGFLAALVSELRAPRPALSRRAWAALAEWSQRINPATALLVGSAVTLAVGNQSSYLYGTPAGILAAGVAGHAAAHPRDRATARLRWKALIPGRSGAAAGVPIGSAYGLTGSPELGVVAGLVSTFAFGLMTSASRPIVDPEKPEDQADLRTLWRRDLQHGLRVGLTAAVPLGSALGVQNGRVNGPVAGAIAAAGIGSIIVLGCMIGICDSWRISLTFCQLRLRGDFPVAGLRFLEDALRRDILRMVGQHIQFKHTDLRDRLVIGYQRRLTSGGTRRTRTTATRLAPER